MKLTRKSIFSGKETTRDLPITVNEIMRWQSGEYIRDVWPDLDPYDQEWLISGLTNEEQDELFNKED